MTRNDVTLQTSTPIRMTTSHASTDAIVNPIPSFKTPDRQEAHSRNDLCTYTRFAIVWSATAAEAHEFVQRDRNLPVKSRILVLLRRHCTTILCGDDSTRRGIVQYPTRLNGTEYSFRDCDELHIQETLMTCAEDDVAWQKSDKMHVYAEREATESQEKMR